MVKVDGTSNGQTYKLTDRKIKILQFHKAKITCTECKTPLKIGDHIVSRKSRGPRHLYHKHCAKKLNILRD